MPAGTSLGSSERVAMATIEEWAKSVSELTIKHLPLLSILQKKGRIKYGCSGVQHRWPIRKADYALQPFPDATPLGLGVRKNTLENATLPWRGYYIADTATLREKLEQGGAEAMVKVFAERADVMRRSAMRGLADEVFADGNATAQVAREAF